MRVANTADVNAEQLQLGAQVCAFKGVFSFENMVNGNLRHFVARSDQTIHAVVPACAFADGIDVRVRSLAGVVNDDTAAWRDVKAALGCQFVAWTNTGREDDEIDFQFATVGKTHGFTRFGAFLNDLFGVFAGVHTHAHAFNFAT